MDDNKYIPNVYGENVSTLWFEQSSQYLIDFSSRMQGRVYTILETNLINSPITFPS